MNSIQAFLLFLALLVGAAMLAFPPVETPLGFFGEYQAVTDLGYGYSVDFPSLFVQFAVLGIVTLLVLAVTEDAARPTSSPGSAPRIVMRKAAEPFASPRDVLIQIHAGTLMASTVATGKELWRIPLASDNDVITRIEGNTLLACCAGEISCIDIRSGELIWQRHFEGKPLHVISAQAAAPARRQSLSPTDTEAAGGSEPMPDATRNEDRSENNNEAATEPHAEFTADALGTLLLRWSFHPARLVIADGRLYFSERGLFGLTATREEIPWHKIAGFSYRSGLFWDALDIETRGQSLRSFRCISKSDAEHLRALMRQIEV